MVVFLVVKAARMQFSAYVLGVPWVRNKVAHVSQWCAILQCASPWWFHTPPDVVVPAYIVKRRVAVEVMLSGPLALAILLFCF